MKCEQIGDFLTHFGWALWGQECDCGHNPFNGLAKRIDPWMNDEAHWNDDCETHGLRKAVGAVGQAFVDYGTKLSLRGME